MGKHLCKTSVCIESDLIFISISFEEDRMFKLRVNFKVMFFSFLVGLALVYILSPQPMTRLQFPTPFNSGHITYRDTGDSCYIYKANEVECSEGETKPQPIFDDS